MEDKQVRTAIATANQRLGEFAAAKDYRGMGSCYTAGAVLLPAGSPAVRGPADIAAFWESAATALGLQGITLTTQELDVSGDCASEVGEAVLAVKSPDGTTGSMKVKYLVVWQRQKDGSWQMHRDMWN